MNGDGKISESGLFFLAIIMTYGGFCTDKSYLFFGRMTLVLTVLSGIFELILLLAVIKLPCIGSGLLPIIAVPFCAFSLFSLSVKLSSDVFSYLPLAVIFAVCAALCAAVAIKGIDTCAGLATVLSVVCAPGLLILGMLYLRVADVGIFVRNVGFAGFGTDGGVLGQAIPLSCVFNAFSLYCIKGMFAPIKTGRFAKLPEKKSANTDKLFAKALLSGFFVAFFVRLAVTVFLMFLAPCEVYRASGEVCAYCARLILGVNTAYVSYAACFFAAVIRISAPLCAIVLSKKRIKT